MYTYLAVVRAADHRQRFRDALDRHFATTIVLRHRRQPALDFRLHGVHPFRGPKFQVFVFIGSTTVVIVVVVIVVTGVAVSPPASAVPPTASTEFALDPLRYVQCLALVARAALGHPLTPLVHQRLGKRLETHGTHCFWMYTNDSRGGEYGIVRVTGRWSRSRDEFTTHRAV